MDTDDYLAFLTADAESAGCRPAEVRTMPVSEMNEYLLEAYDEGLLGVGPCPYRVGTTQLAAWFRGRDQE